MKKQILLLITFLAFLNLGFGHGNHKSDSGFNILNLENEFNNLVVVCTGDYAYAFHSNVNCSGLNNCQGEMVAVDVSRARYIGRKPCCICLSSMGSDCVNDGGNSYGGGGGSGDAAALGIIAIAVVSLSAIVLSNDIYIHTTNSFIQEPNYNGLTSNLAQGITAGFRKTFKRSALEYGASYLTYGGTSFWAGDYNNSRMGYHLNFVQNLFYSSLPKWFSIYLGPSINSINYEFGYGGIGGVSFNLGERFKFDFRYERTNLTNQIMGGIILKYQKKYLWQK